MKSDSRKQLMYVALFITVIMILVIPAAAEAQEIPWAGPTSLPDYVGAPAKAHPTANSRVPQNPLLWPNPFSMVHMDPWNSDVFDLPAPLGRDPVVFSSTLADARQNPDSKVFQYAGSGTTPTILGNGKYVAITDNAEPWMHVVVYRTDEPPLNPNEERMVCEVPVFTYARGGALDNSLVGSGLSMIVENNYGFEYDLETMKATDSEPGFERIDIDPNGKGCTKIWVNTDIASTVSAKLSTRTGLIYTVSRKHDDQNDVWAYYWTALDFRTGETVWQKMAGTGEDTFDNLWSGLNPGPNGTLYVGVLGGLAAIRDDR